jgi:hypothetical protein
MDCLCPNIVRRDIRRIGTEYDLPKFRTIAKVVVYVVLIAIVDFLNPS